MRRTNVLLLALGLSLSSCRRQGISAAREVASGATVPLAAGEEAVISGTNTRLRVDDIADSRCPADVRCVWAGEATVVVTFTGAGDARTDTLHLQKRRALDYGGHQIRVTDVQPYPRSAGDSSRKIATIGVDGPI